MTIRQRVEEILIDHPFACRCSVCWAFAMGAYEGAFDRAEAALQRLDEAHKRELKSEEVI